MTTAIERVRHEDGFTLVELMIVMTVLGILTGLVLFAVGPFQDAANTAKKSANDDTCRTASAVAIATPSADDANAFVDGGTGC